MRSLILCCLVALATCQNLRYDLVLNPKKTYEYSYQGAVHFGLGKPNLAESGARMTCKVKIAGVSARTFTLQLFDLTFDEFNGFPGKNGFTAAPKVAQHIAAQLAKPFTFEFAGGHVGDIHAAAEVSNTVVNFIRGILDFFSATIKTTQRFYELEEVCIHGLCQSSYAIEENKETKDMVVSQVVDVGACREKAAFYSGMAAAVPDKMSRQKGESVASTVRYVYTVRPTAEGGVIAKAHALERQHFSPFNVKGGSFQMQATKELTLLGVSDAAGAAVTGPMDNRGNLVYKFVNADANLPITMQSLADPIPKAIALVKHLAEANKYQIDNAATEDTIKLYQLLRVIPFEGLDVMWKQFAANAEHRSVGCSAQNGAFFIDNLSPYCGSRPSLMSDTDPLELIRRWFLDMIVEVSDARVLKFLEMRFEAGDVTATEALQTLVLAVNHLQAIPDLVEMAKMFLTMPFCKSNVYLWNTVVLSYGSLVYRHCARYSPCPVAAVQPLVNLATEAMKAGNEADMVLALKALGNAGHPGSIKTILRFLPGVAATPMDLPPRVQIAAVQSMRLIAARDPHIVQDIAMTLFLQRNLPAEARMLAFKVLFEAKPSAALVYMLAARLQEEKDLHVVSFALSYMRSFARSTTPDNHFLSTACNVAMKTLAPTFGHLSLFYSKTMRLDWFNDDFLIGTAAEVFMLKSATHLFPTEMTMRGRFYFIGRVLQLLELGVHAGGIKELFGSTIPGFKGDLSVSDFQAIFNVLKNWESLPNDKPVFSAFTRLFGQEWFYADVKKDFIQYFVKAFSSAAGKGTPLWELVEDMQRGASFHWTKPFLVLEARYFQATTLGFPVEISKYYQTVNGITVNTKATVNPPLTDRLGQLLTSDISLKSDGYIGFTKDFWVFYGINTDIFQSGCEFKAKTPFSIPWSFVAKINVPAKKFEFDFPSLKKEFEFFSVSSNVFAISRNVAEPAMAKMTPIMPNIIDCTANQVSNQNQQSLAQQTWHPRVKKCFESSIYGARVCVESELRRAYYHEEYPLSYFLGYTHFAMTIAPAQAIRAVDRIHLEVSAGPSRRPTSTLQLLQTLRSLSKEPSQQSLDATPEAVFNIKAFAISGNQKPEGYDAAVYYTPEANLHSAQLIVSRVGEATNWKMCVDTSVNMAAEAKTQLRWGAECQPYEMSMTAAFAHTPDSKPALMTKLHWAAVPETWAAMGKRIESYVPGMAFFLGFYQTREANAKQEVSAWVAAASPDTVDVKIDFPEYTVYRPAISVPMPPASVLDSRNTTIEGCP